MEVTLSTVKQRSLLRRMLPWTASLGLFAGGGVGVYQYAAPRSETSETATTAEALRSDAGIQRVFEEEAAAHEYTPPQSRYALQGGAASAFSNGPTLPPEPESESTDRARTAAATVPFGGPLATTPLDAPPARYAVTPASNEIELPQAAPPIETPTEQMANPVVEAPQQPAAEPADTAHPEVARGQEPDSGNPLRGGGAQSAAHESSEPAGSPSSEKARAAFSTRASGAAPLRALDLGAGTPPATNQPSDSNGLQNEMVGGGRYGGTAPAVTIPSDEPRQPIAAPTGTPARTPQAPLSAAAPQRFAPQQAAPESFTPDAGGSLPITAAPEQGSRSDEPVAAFVADAGRTADITRTPGLTATDGTGTPGEQLLEGVQSPTLTLEKLVPPEVQVGKKATFAIRVQNTGQRPAHNVQIRDETPLGAQLLGTAPRAKTNGSVVIWDIGAMSPGEERIVEMELLPTEEGELGSVATVTFAAQASAKARCTRPQLALRLSAGPKVMIGEQHIVDIELSNPGSGDATGVMLMENVPAGVSHEAGPALEFEVGTLRAGETRRLQLVLHAEEAGVVENVMVARGDASLQVQGSCEFEVIAPDLKVSVDGPQKRFLERPATYTVSIDNPGTASAKEVHLITQLPRGMQFVSANNMGEYDAATHSVVWSLAELPAHERGSVELTALPIEPGEHTLQVATRAQQGLEDRTETRVTVEGLVALSFEVSAADGAIEVGGETSYDIRVLNQGSKAASNVQVTVVMPPGLRPVSGQGDTRQIVEGNAVRFAPLPQLAPKSEAKFRVRVQGLQPGDQRARVQITTDEVQDPITKEQSTRVYADE